ncbi:uncharacterized protein TrAFT101_002704 [Trichoderma asperellum]|uniref:Hypervirulence associated protein TUDOR domain-containing protein n=1 Tax=Trichoderma asperellum (strain ATCC 204424 / CBS 433.97 / NBRC 101777) TaxID=1042311 RepID=A0A2T3ZH60_TRIA4|nr:hypothetical protein M441DRAFT_186491 [Trichoderma asperellum CBS 433.97]PTB44147.1 hypothetical protein M441DRAFT_186491 [Trichoderma asperellum CBS 433.97]UKZ86881.1 hypothetical protein TrAFT101_002704 [Trichoderma asperellum]
MKEKSEVIQEFRELVNMSAKELKEWLKGDESEGAGWPKDDASGESVGHDSGRQIVDILEANSEKDPEKYTDDHVSHMRKVVAYIKRHLAQEEKANSKKPVEEVKKTKSYASLKNWGHDTIKKREANGGGAEADAEGEEQEEETAEEEKAGEKRKAPDDQSGTSKKRETEDGAAAVDNGDEEKDEQADVEEEKDSKKGEHPNGKEGGNEKEAKGPEKGDTVSWNWGQGQPEGTVKEVNPGEATIETKKGNEVSRKGKEEDPAVVIDTGKSDAVKLAHELNETKD